MNGTGGSATTLYVAGPMSGLPDFNRSAFDAAARALRGAGFRVMNPAENVPPVATPGWADFMRMSVRQVAVADGLALLPGWAASRGATLEVRIACELGIVCAPFTAWVAVYVQESVS